jgi:putative oxidoreductase
VTLVGIPALVVLLVAIVTVHLPNGFSSIKLQSVDAMGAHFGQPGYENDLLYIVCILALMVRGAGPWSVDGWIVRRLKKSSN